MLTSITMAMCSKYIIVEGQSSVLRVGARILKKKWTPTGQGLDITMKQNQLETKQGNKCSTEWIWLYYPRL